MGLKQGKLQSGVTADESDVRAMEEQHPFLPIDISANATTLAPTRTESTSQRYSTLLTAVFFFSSFFLVVSAIWFKPQDSVCVQKLNAWSPMLEAVQYHRVDHNAEAKKAFMGIPTDQLEKAWDRLWQFGSLGISEDSLPLLNKSISDYDWHHVSPELGGGIQAYFEGFHQIHCLNLVRQYTYKNEYDYSHHHAFTNPRISALEHVEHCLEILRTKIMCESDTTPYLVLHAEKGMALDIGAPKRCRDFSNMVEWANDHITVPFDEETS